MIIRDLEHFETANQVKQVEAVEGGISQLNVNLSVLATGFGFTSVTSLFDGISIAGSPNLSGFEFTLVVQAA